MSQKLNKYDEIVMNLKDNLERVNTVVEALKTANNNAMTILSKLPK
jgi:hypothetical protein